MLIQIANTHMLVPFHLALIRCKCACYNIHKGTFTFTICSNQSDMFTGKQPERYIIENGSVSKTMCQIFYI